MTALCVLAGCCVFALLIAWATQRDKDQEWADEFGDAYLLAVPRIAGRREYGRRITKHS